jgi:hypothetical protein
MSEKIDNFLAVVDDKVDHPSHYTKGKFEVIDIIDDWGFDKDYYLANSVKYIGRAYHKGKFLSDLKKAVWYLERRIAREVRSLEENDPAAKDRNTI